MGNPGYRRGIDLQSSSTSGALDKSPSTPFPFRTGLTSGNVKDLKACTDQSLQPPGGGKATSLQEYKTVSPSHVLLENDLKNAVSSLLPKKASDNLNIVKLAISAWDVTPSGRKPSLRLVKTLLVLRKYLRQV